jgi:hypothetical protein
MKKHHKYTHTHVEHHSDGSATVHHVHVEGPHKDAKHAAADLDHVHDSMQDHLGTPNPGEGMDVNNAPMASAAPAAGAVPGLPGGAAPAAA